MARNDNHKPSTVFQEQAQTEAANAETLEAPVEVSKYTEGEPLQEPEIISEGDPGTYIGEYESQNPDEDEVEPRTDLPEGYVAGTYAGEYESI